MKSLKDTKTAVNLMKAFAGESQARNRYTFYASQAKKEGFIQISNVFGETADNEREHAKIFFKLLNEDLGGNTIPITADFPVSLGNTKDNLGAAANGEHGEWSVLYPAFAKDADDEGFSSISKVFREIAEIEKRHEIRFQKLFNNIDNNSVFTKDKPVLWKCLNCGYIFEGAEAPDICPACLHPQGYFEVFVESY